MTPRDLQIVVYARLAEETTTVTAWAFGNKYLLELLIVLFPPEGGAPGEAERKVSRLRSRFLAR